MRWGLMLNLTPNTPTLEDTIEAMMELVQTEEGHIVGQAFTLRDPGGEGARALNPPQCSATRKDPHRVLSHLSPLRHHSPRLRRTAVVQNQPRSTMCQSCREKDLYCSRPWLQDRGSHCPGDYWASHPTTPKLPCWPTFEWRTSSEVIPALMFGTATNPSHRLFAKKRCTTTPLHKSMHLVADPFSSESGRNESSIVNSVSWILGGTAITPPEADLVRAQMWG